MRSTAILLVYLVSIFLVVLVMLAQLNIRPDIIFYLMVIGQFLVVFMVYKVLTDSNYKTTKTFDDWYEDNPVEKE